MINLPYINHKIFKLSVYIFLLSICTPYFSTLAPDTNAQEEDTMNSSTATAEDSPSPTTEDEAIVIIEDEKNKFTGQNFDDLPWKNSVMFNNDELEYIYDSLKIRMSGGSRIIPEPIDISDADEDPTPRGPTTITPSVAPAFYLNSMLFYNASNWTVWVNSRRIRRNTALNRLQIGRITKNYVEFIWKPLNLDLISPNWTEKVSPISEIYYEEPISLQEANDDIPTADVTPENLQETANNIQETLGALEDPNTIQNTLNEQTKVTTDEQESNEKLDLPPLFIQEEFSMNVDKLVTLLKEEEIEIADRKAAEEAVRIARQVETVEGEDEEDNETAYDAFKEKDVPYLWDYKSDDGNILIDTINGVVQFRVGINQTFVSRTMEIAEGHVKSTILSSTTQETQELRTQDLERAIFEYQPPSR